ncbi:MAG: hypothetical protein OXI12_01710, partial [Gammaproteobacteria bacterium]|nr:hypothetical protein [Gammaproteobacteria bacterium]
APISFDAIDADPYGDPWASLCAVAACRRSDGPLAVVWTDGAARKTRLTGWVSPAVTALTGIEPARGLGTHDAQRHIQRAALDGLASSLAMEAGEMRFFLRSMMFYAAAIITPPRVDKS